MTSLAQHTPLESLLLLHALRSDGLTALRFSRVSEQLKNIPLVRNDPTFDSARLEVDALKHLYLRLLKDEAHDSPDQAQDNKCRQPSPSTLAIDDDAAAAAAAKHSHLIPRLVHRLYTRYRESIVAEIRNEEARYDTLTREIGEIESGQWDDKLRTKSDAVTVLPTASPTASQSEAFVKSATTDALPQTNGHAASPGDQTEQPSQASEAIRVNRTRIDAVINHGPSDVRPMASPTPPLPASVSQPMSQQQQQTAQKASQAPQATSLPPLSEMAPEPPAPHPAMPQHVHHGHPLPSPLPPAAGYRVSPIMQQNGFPPQFARPQQSPQHSPSPSSPRPVLPLPPGMSMPPHPPTAVQNRAGSAQHPSPTQRMAPVPLQPAPRPAHVHTPPTYHQPFPPYQQQQQQQQQQQHQMQYPVQQQPPSSYNSRPPHQGGRQLPPFQVSAQDPNRMHQHHLAHQQTAQQQQARPPPTPARHPASAPYSPHTPYAYPAPPQSARAGPVGDILKSLTKTSRPSTPRPTWKHIRPAYLARPQEVASPAVEKSSPPQSRTSSPAPKVDGASARPKLQKGSSAQPEETPEPTAKPTRSSRLSTRRNRASSPASSVVASSTRARSRSILSHVDANLLQVEPTGVVKDEPMTPAELLQEEILHAETSDAPSTVKSSRPLGRRSSRKRKRGRSASPLPSSDPPAGDDQESEKGPAYDPLHKNKIQGHRNFARTSQPILNDITQHKHAGPFQKPVREKDAEGYADIIKRPQDLKSIKTAITVGGRAIAAAAASTSIDSPAATPSGTGNASSVVLLDKTVDLIPPRAIVNSSQLEKEVMRMFANAVMFNPGDGGMVQDAREMADDIEAKVRDWRQVEGAAASSRAAVQADDVDDDTGASTPAVSSKRRKI